MNTKIYVITHKKVLIPELLGKPEYLLLQCGPDSAPDLGYLRANRLDNISHLNWFYCELTGYYWAWKNVSCDIIGFLHYHRFLYHNGLLLSKDVIESMLHTYDFIVPHKSGRGQSFFHTWLNYQTETEALETLGMLLQTKYPEFYDSYITCVHTTEGKWSRNIMITKKPLFDEYCKFLFSILEELRPLLHFDMHPTNWKKPNMLGGYLGELLFNVWVSACGYTAFPTELISYGWRSFDLK